MDKLFKIGVMVLSCIVIISLLCPLNVLAGQYVAVSFSATSSATVGQEFAVNVILDTATKQVSAAELHISYPADKLQALSIVKGDFLPSVLQDGAVGAGVASITVGSSTTPKTGIGTIAVITFRAVASGVATLSFADTTQIAAVGYTANVLEQKPNSNITLSGNTITFTPTLVLSATPTSTITPTRTPVPIPSVTHPVSQIQTGFGDSTIIAFLFAASLVFLYAGYTRLPIFRRRDIKNIAKEHSPLDFRN